MNNETEKPHSKLGIFSFVLGLLPAIGTILILSGAGTPGKTAFYLVVSGGALILLSSVGAFVFGLLTLFQKRTTRVFGVIGFFVGLIEVVTIVLLIVLFAAFMEALGIALGSGFGKM